MSLAGYNFQLHTRLLSVSECWSYVYLYFQVDSTTSTGEGLEYEMLSIESQSELDRRKAGMSLSLSPVRQPPPNVTTPHDNDEESGQS